MVDFGVGVLQVARIMRAALRTLAQCHARGILHRDIKPGNFLFLKTDEASPIKAVGESITASDGFACTVLCPMLWCLVS